MVWARRQAAGQDLQRRLAGGVKEKGQADPLRIDDDGTRFLPHLVQINLDAVVNRNFTDKCRD